MHQWLFRLRHGLSGSYCSLAKRSDLYRRISHALADDNDLHGQLCPLCGVEDGDRWHVFWRCQLAEPGLPECSDRLRTSLFDFAEQALASLGFPWSAEPPCQHQRRLAYPEHAHRYPLLVQAGWLLPTLAEDGHPAGDLASPPGLLCLATWRHSSPNRAKCLVGLCPLTRPGPTAASFANLLRSRHWPWFVGTKKFASFSSASCCT